jgi:hypothetical protein
MTDIDKIRKRHKDNEGYIAKLEKQGRWWWMDMHQICHNDRATLLDHIAKSETIDKQRLEQISALQATVGKYQQGTKEKAEEG